MKPITAAYILLVLGIGVEANVPRRHKPDSACTDLLHAYPSASPVQVHTAKQVQAGGLNITNDAGSPVHNTIAICHVQGTIKYAAGPEAHAAEYNGRYLAVGNGGYAGTIDNYTMLTHLNSGFAVGGCDSGHHINENGNNTGFAPYMNDPAKVEAWIHDSIALTTRVARDTITMRYYNHLPKHSYYYGCLTGGGQGYSLAEFYPQLFDGVVAEGPRNYYSHLVLSFLWNQQHTIEGKTGFMDQGVLDFVTREVLDACDAIDGVEDRVIENPLRCDFDIGRLECRPGQIASNETTCLTSEQVTAARYIYSGAKDARDGKQVYPGFNFGAEPGWLSQQTSLFNSYGAPILRQLVFNNAEYDAVANFNWGSDLDAVYSLASPLIDGISTNLSAFHARGGKLITAQGWSDPINAATWPMRHMSDIADVMGKQTVDEFMRLFMIPGGGHCGANAAYPHVPAEYHVLDALVEWVEKGTVPDDGVLSSAPPDGSNTTRRLCPWPSQAVFVGGDEMDWMSYECAVA